MPRIDPHLIPVVTDLARGLRDLDVPFAIIGALVPELLLAVRPVRMTNDADATVIVQSAADFETLKDRLATYGFSRTRVQHRLLHQSGGRLDLLPFSDAFAPGGRLEFDDGVVLNMAGFHHVVPNATSVALDNGPTLPIAPLPLYVLLKLVAYSDRKAPKDLASVLHCLEHYLEDDDRRYGVEHDGDGVPYEYACAYLLGLDGRPFHDSSLRASVLSVLARFDSPDADVVGITARENDRLLPDGAYRNDIVERFRWYRLGGGL
jgi:predicted nucleotidyltransferase